MSIEIDGKPSRTPGEYHKAFIPLISECYVRSIRGYLVFGSDLDFRLQMLTFFRNVASTARNQNQRYSCRVA